MNSFSHFRSIPTRRVRHCALVAAVALGCGFVVIGCGKDSADDTAPPGPDPNANADGDCLTDVQESQHGTDPRSPDTDRDTLTDCDEIELGTSPTLADTDGDTVTDPDEVACVSDPLDAAEKCYACGWKHNDPGNLVSTGKNTGQVIDNMQLVDQCLETVSLWDFAATDASPVPEPASYYILFMTAAW